MGLSFNDVEVASQTQLLKMPKQNSVFPHIILSNEQTRAVLCQVEGAQECASFGLSIHQEVMLAPPQHFCHPPNSTGLGCCNFRGMEAT